ncbi:MAG: thioredoxin family protein [Ignavibacteriales bacterium]|nr:thioredoxin family protein [Melioribacteraceae bacterium]MCF8316635.1 thioredoxin family protein [Ignavibacteriales bacterium]MCF8438245.1 thioredoxin family protein [Ignavibacteriales bacterium]
MKFNKYLIFGAILLLGAAVIAYQPGSESPATDSLKWETNLEQAIKTATKENKNILVNFTGSDWCQWCIRLTNEVFSKDEFGKYAQKNLVLVKLDFPRTIPQTEAIKAYNMYLARRYGVQGFPTILLLDRTGKVVGKTGYQAGGANAYVAHLKKFFNQPM